MTIDVNWLPAGNHWGLEIEHRPSHRPALPMSGGGVGNSVTLHTFQDPPNSDPIGMHNYLENTGDVVHITANLVAGHIVQALPLTGGAYGLVHSAGPSPNTSGIHRVQIECAGYAASSANDTEIMLKHLGALLQLVNHRIKMGLVSHLTEGRMTDSKWANLKGIAGHLNAPQNNHVDPGHIDMHKVLDYARGY